MKDKVFFDTNILVYIFDKNEPEKSAIAKGLLKQYGTDGRLIISTQVLQELYVTLTKKNKMSMPKEQAEEIINHFSEYLLVVVNKGIIKKAMKTHQGSNFSFWDSLIVEAAIQADCGILYSEDMQNNFKIGSLTIQNPFEQEL